MLSSKKWGTYFCISAVGMLVLLGTVTAVIDPYFHYHGPIDGLAYPIYNERYQNDGIVKHFSYDAIITGTSMTQNFKTSELDGLFDTKSVKVPFAGGTYREINENLERAVAANQGTRLIVRGLDYRMLDNDKDQIWDEPERYPTYLYDDVIWNDVKYIFNKSVLLLGGTCTVVWKTISGEQTTDFDSYSNWTKGQIFGKEAFAGYVREERALEKLYMSEDDCQRLRGNLEQNVARLAAANPQIEFYLFFTPYSIYYWDGLYQAGTLQRQLELEEEAVRILLEYDNIYLFSFFDEFDMICNQDNYRDEQHYGEWVNSQILLWMRNKEHLLTKDNYQEYFGKVYDFYTTYDYDALFSRTISQRMKKTETAGSGKL